jgi:5'-3' exonuclease
MGVKGLYSYLRPYRHQVDLQTVSKGVIGVDALSVLYKFRGNTEMILKFLEPFLSLGCTPLFVFDGKAPEEKKEEIETRKAKRNDAREEAASLKAYLELPETASSLDEKGKQLVERKIRSLEMGEGWYITRAVRRSFQDVLRAKNIPFVKAKGEADDVLMSLWSDKKLLSIISCDMDFLVAGVERLWIPNMNGCEEILLSKVLEKEDLTMNSFMDAAILCGVSSGYVFLNMYPQKAFTFMRHYGSLEVLSEKQPHKFTIDRSETLQIIRGRFLLFVKAEELVREEYRDVLKRL